MYMCTHSIDDLLPHAPLHYAATGEMVKGSSLQQNVDSTNIYLPSLGLMQGVLDTADINRNLLFLL